MFVWIPAKLVGMSGLPIAEVKICVCVMYVPIAEVKIYVCVMCMYIGRLYHNPPDISHCLYLQLFLTYRSYPSVVPITVVTEGGETDEFCAHFSSWPLVDLSLTQSAELLKLEEEKSYEVVFPSSRATTVSE